MKRFTDAENAQCSFFLIQSFLIAFHNDRDENHKKARNFYESLLRSREVVIFFISDYVFDETMTFLLSRAGKAVALSVGEKLLQDPLIKLIPIDEDFFQKTWTLFKRFKDKEWSFTDCSSYAVMKELGIPYGASFDLHFRQFDFTILPSGPQWR